MWSSLYVGTSGLQTSHNALNTVAHNLTNADTDGFTRQQVEQSDKIYMTISKSASAISYQQSGLGVTYSNVKQIRDYFLDKQFRKESGRSMFYEVSKDTLLEVEDLLGEMNGEAFQTQLSDLWTSIQELSKDPCSSVTQSTLVQEASEFLTRAQSVYDGLSSYQDNLNLQVKQQIEKINEYGKQILELNDQIRKIEMGKIEHANDLKDQRNLILDELSKLVDISYDTDVNGNVFVQIEGEDFVKGGTCYQIGLNIDSVTGFYTPFWPQNANVLPGSDEFSNGRDMLITTDGVLQVERTNNGVTETLRKTFDLSNALVFNLNREVSSELGTDIGGVKSMLLARGDHRASYADIAGGTYDKVSQSVLMNVQAEFDQLIHNTITAVNDVLAEAAGVKNYNIANPGTAVSIQTNPGGTTTTVPVDLGNNVRLIPIDTANPKKYLTDEEGIPYQLFTKIAGDGYQRVSLSGVTYTDEEGNTQTLPDGDYWMYNEESFDPEEIYTLYSLANTQINQKLMQAPALLGFRLSDGSEDIATMEKLKAVFTDEKYTLNPNVLKSVSIMGYYDDLVSQVANSAYVYDAIFQNQENTVSATESARDQVHAVSSDEELSNMIKFQSAYNASSRFINVVDEMLEHLLTSLA
ncbi:MAG: flagellar hook-associated protein FlgK [Lachnospiraceae bacterium]|nr:flagellar hook-associated protein FlgK [Lachnospiraceae bacterium]